MWNWCKLEDEKLKSRKKWQDLWIKVAWYRHENLRLAAKQFSFKFRLVKNNKKTPGKQKTPKNSVKMSFISQPTLMRSRRASKTSQIGQIQIIVGPMFSGKSTELIRRLKRYQIARYECLIVKYAKDLRYDSESIATHDQQTLKANSVPNFMLFLTKTPKLCHSDFTWNLESQSAIFTHRTSRVFKIEFT